MTLSQATTKSEEIVAALKPYCHRIEVAGSVRRKKMEDIKDIEICAIPNNQHLASIRELVNQKWGNPEIGAFPSKYTKVRGSVAIDFFWLTKENWGLQFFIRTGPAEFVKRALAYWKEHTGGYSEGGILHNDAGSIVPTLEEEDVFKALEVAGGKPCPFIAPEKRLAIKSHA